MTVICLAFWENRVVNALVLMHRGQKKAEARCPEPWSALVILKDVPSLAPGVHRVGHEQWVFPQPPHSCAPASTAISWPNQGPRSLSPVFFFAAILCPVKSQETLLPWSPLPILPWTYLFRPIWSMIRPHPIHIQNWTAHCFILAAPWQLVDVNMWFSMHFVCLRSVSSVRWEAPGHVGQPPAHYRTPYMAGSWDPVAFE